MPSFLSWEKSIARRLRSSSAWPRPGQDSGQYRGERGTWGGRKSARSALYMAALVATRCNRRLSDFYHGLVERGKAKKVALVATMRKLVIRLNTMVKNGEPWQPDLHRASA